MPTIAQSTFYDDPQRAESHGGGAKGLSLGPIVNHAIVRRFPLRPRWLTSWKRQKNVKQEIIRRGRPRASRRHTPRLLKVSFTTNFIKPVRLCADHCRRTNTPGVEGLDATVMI